jgi:6-pyruvoyltetrahydropterin/6-carboxytetrahydropterin synthase
MYTISKQFTFDASHQLMGMPEGHPCGRLHGHTYTVIVELKGPNLTPEGFLRDYGNLKPIKEYIDSTLDHRHLNDVLNTNPTAELIALHIFEYFKHDFPEMNAVSVKETPKTIARYEPDNNSR